MSLEEFKPIPTPESLSGRPETISLITPAQFAELPEGATLVDSFGNEVKKGDPILERQDARQGFLPFGFVPGTEPESMVLKPRGNQKIDHEVAEFLATQNLDNLT